MTGITHAAALTGLAAALCACSIREASINEPFIASDTDQLEVRGIGGRRKGNFTVAGIPAKFTRTADQLAFVDPFAVTRSGSGSFNMSASPMSPELAGRCSYQETTVTRGSISITPGRLTYHCEFMRSGRKSNAQLIIRDSAGALGAYDGKFARDGYLEYEGVQLRIFSVHRPVGGGLESPAPLGYHFKMGGRIVGAVDLNGPNKDIYSPRTGLEREAVIAAALALSVFWDPADTEAATSELRKPFRKIYLPRSSRSDV